MTAADVLVQRLRDHGIRHIFGYPGGQLTPIYDALYRQTDIRHILARHEQAAAFMADGFARATGKPGVCLAVCGPGVFNAATPLATAFTDSIPLVLISGQVPKRGRRTGYYHENEQLESSRTFTKEAIRVEEATSLLREIDRAFGIAVGGRPGPVLLEIPLDVLRGDLDTEGILLPPAGYLFAQDQGHLEVDILAKLPEVLAGWKRPLILVGGGMVSAKLQSSLGSAEAALPASYLGTLAWQLGAPVLHTLMGKSALSADHPFAAGLTWHRATADVSNMTEHFSPLLREADGLLALGCRFSQAATGSWQMPLPAQVVQIDIDAAEIGRHFPVTLGIEGDLAQVMPWLLSIIPQEPREPWAKLSVPREPWRLPRVDLVGPLRRVLPRDAIVAADITRLSYILLAEFPVYAPRSFLHPAGFVSMGFGLPAALGAKAAFPDRTVVAIEGDGCLQMCGMELATMVQEKLPVIIVLINDRCLSLIKATQERRYEGRFIGVDLQNPDFGQFTRAFGVRYWSAANDAEFEMALVEAVDSGEPALVEVVL